MAEDNKILYFLQFPHDFFNSRRIKKLRKMDGGDLLVVLYLKLQLSTLETKGFIFLSGIEDDPAEEIALELNEDPNAVRTLLDFLLKCGLAKKEEDGSIFLPYVEIMTTSHTKGAERKRKYRENKAQKESENGTPAGQPRDNPGTNVGQAWDNVPTEYKSIRVEESKRVEEGIDKEVNVPSTIQPTVPESICSLSNDNECGTGIVPRKDVRHVMEAWNALGLTPIKDIKPDTERGRMVKKRLQDYGVEEVLNAIRNVGDSLFLMGKTGKFQATFDWVIRPNNFIKVLEGNYRDGPKKVYAQDDLFYRTGKTLGNRVSRRLGLPEDTEETRQAYAAEMEACARETGADVGTEIKDAVFFSQSDPFWQSRIVDAKSFRLNFRKILADMRRKDS